MKSRNLIFLTFGIAIALLLTLQIIKTRPLPDYGKKIAYTTKSLKVYGDDGTFLPTDVLIPEKPSGRTAILLADRHLDRNWNTIRISFDTGKIIAHILASNGIATVVYDQRDSGLSVRSGKNYANPSNLSDDIRIIYKTAMELDELKHSSVDLIAHGEGCLTGLLAASKFKLKIKTIYLLNCAASQSYLDFWGRQLMQNMKRSGVDASILAQAETIIEEWKHKKGYEPVDLSEKTDYGDTDSDLIPLLHGLNYMQTEEMIGWTREAKEIYMVDEIKKAIRSGIKIVHVFSEFDEELPPDELRFYKEKGKTAFDPKGYTQVEIPKADHFFFETEERPFFKMKMIVQRINPLKKIRTPLFDVLLEER